MSTTHHDFIVKHGLSLADNTKIKIGNSDDLQIFHDGTNSHATSSTGQFFLTSSNSNIWLRGGEAGILNTAGTEYMIRATSNGSVKLFYDNVKKFETTSTGIDVTGAITSSDKVQADYFKATSNIPSETSANTGYFDVFGGFTRIISKGADGSTLGGFSILQQASDSSPAATALSIDTSSNATFSGSVTANAGIQIDALNLDGRTIASTDPNGNINIHPNGSGTVNVSTSLMVGSTTAPSAKLHIDGATSSGLLKLDVNAGVAGNILFRKDDSRSTSLVEWSIQHKNDNQDFIIYGYDGTTFKNLIEYDWSASTTKLGSGNVGIGVSPAYKLHISGATNANDVVIQNSSHGVALRMQANTNSMNIFTTGSKPLYLGTNNTTNQVVIDTSGNLLVGRTSASGVDTDGHVLFENGVSYQSMTDNAAQFVNRNGTGDGSITSFHKNGTAVGSIGVSNFDLTIQSSASGHNGLRFGDAWIAPIATNQALDDGTTDLGLSGARFKDLYLSNDINVGNDIHLGNGSYLNFGDTGTSIYGSNSLDLLIFKTANQERLRIDSQGRVGINRTPSISNSKLEVSGADNVSLINVEASGNTGGMGIGSTGLQFFHGSTAHMRITSAGNVGIGTSSPSRQLSIYGTNDGYMSFNGGRAGNHEYVVGSDSSGFIIYDETLDTYRLVIDQDSGNVGIGTSSPGAKLEISGKDDSGISDLLRLQFDNVPADTGITFTDINSTLKNRISMDSGNTNDLQISASTQMTFHTSSLTNANERMRIDGSGKVGIGTASPAYKLDVAGTFHAKVGSSAIAFNEYSNGATIWLDGSNGDFTGGDYFGIHAFGTTDLAFGYAGSQNMTLKNTGNLGIGTTAPANKLEVKASANDNGIMLKSTTNADLIWLHQQSTSEGVLRIYGSGGAKVIIPGHNSPTYFNNGNNFGIGTSAPSEKLHLQVSDVGSGSGEVAIRMTVPASSISAQNEIRSGVTSGTNPYMSFAVRETGSPYATLERMRISSSGKVGIGTTTPTMPLSVQAASNAYAISMHGRSDGYSELYGASNDGSTKYSFLQSHSAQTKLYTLVNTPLLFGTNSTERMRISNTGNVGIGTQSPSAALHIQTNDSTTNALVNSLMITNLSSGTTTTGFGGEIRFQAERNNGVNQNTGRIASVAEVNSGTNISSGLSFWTSAVGVMDEKVRISYDGKVGIGTTSPSSLLHVAGNANITGTLSVGTFAPTSISITSGTVKLDGNHPSGTGNVALGDGAGGSLASGANRNVLIGKSAGAGITTGDYNTAVGYHALTTDDVGERGTAIGYFALANLNYNGAHYNTAVGFSAGEVMTTGIYNTLLGGLAGDAITTGVRNTALGTFALTNTTTQSNNTAMGYNALTTNVNGGRNTAVGADALALMNPSSSGNSYNAAFGYAAGTNMTTAVQNTLLGSRAGVEITTGNYNTAVGYNSLGLTTTGYANVAIGRESLYDLTTGSHNVSAGFASAENMTTGSQNVALGSYTLQAQTTAHNNTAVGYYSAAVMTSGTANVSVGTYTLNSNTTGAKNTAIGYDALGLEDTGHASTAVGYQALRNQNYDGFAYNTAVGYLAGTTITAGHSNTLLGTASGDALTSGSYNTAVGLNSAGAATTGSQNTSVGQAAGTSMTTGQFNVYIGDGAGAYLTVGSSNVALGQNALRGDTGGVTTSGLTAIGRQVFQNITTGHSNVGLGHQAGLNVTTGHSNTLLGYDAARTMTTGVDTTAVGRNALRALTTGSTNTAVGSYAGYALTTGVQNTFLGAYAGDAITTGDNNVALGQGSLANDDVGLGSTAIGTQAMTFQNTASATYTLNTAVGFQSLYYNVTGQGNTTLGYRAGFGSASGASVSGLTAIGYNAGVNITTGTDNTFVGNSSGGNTTTGDLNVAIGSTAMYTNTVGDRSVAIGYQALYYQNPSSNVDMYNTAVGYNAGAAITTGQNNTFIGGLAGDAKTTANNNTAVGRAALTSAGSGSENTAVGASSLHTLTTGIGNQALGWQSGYYLTTGTYNSLLGHNSGVNLTTGSSNTILGGFAGDAITTAAQNTVVGYNALTTATTAAGNTAIGHNSLASCTTSGYNTAVGWAAADALTTGSAMVAVGTNAGGATTTGHNQTAIGYSALALNTTGSSSVAVGYNSLTNATNGPNTAVGSSSLEDLTTGYDNTAVGRNAGANITTAIRNTAIGDLALTTNTTGHYNTAVGGYSSRYLTTGTRNTTVGYQAGEDITTGAYNTFIGERAGTNTTTALNNTVVGSGAYNVATTGTNNVAMGQSALVNCTTGSQNTAIGYQAANDLTTGGNNTALGRMAMHSGTTVEQNVSLGYNTMYNTTAGYQVAVGANALFTNTSGAQNVAVGYKAMHDNTTATGGTALGYESLANNTTGAYNTSIGHFALYDNTTGALNTAVGANALANNTTGNSSVAVGQGSLSAATSAIYNVAIGQQSLTTTSTGGQNVAVGYSTLQYYTGHDAVAIGAYAGQYATSGTNISIGSQAGRNYTTGGNNVAIGVLSQTTGQTNTYNTSIGSYALRYVTGDNNTALGAYAGHATTSGHSNVFIARNAGLYNTTGLYNIGVGVSALRNNVAANRNTAVGHNALYHMTASSSNDTNNTAVGFYSGRNVSTGVQDTFIGSNAGRVVTTGGYSTFVGTSSGYNATTGNYNTAVGRESMFNLTTGSSNTSLGRNAGQGNSTGDSNVAIGALSLLTGNAASYRTAVGTSAGYSSTGASNVFLGSSSGYHMTTGANNTILGPFGGNNYNLDLRTASNNVVIADGGGVPKMWIAGEAVRFGGSYENNTIVLSSVTTTSASGGVGGANRMELEFMEPSSPNFGAKKLRLGVLGGGYVKMEFPGSGGLYAHSPYNASDRIHLGYGGIQLDMLHGGYTTNENMLIRCVNAITFCSGGSGESARFDSSKNLLLGCTSAGDFGITLDPSPSGNSVPSMEIVRDFSGTSTYIRFTNISGSPYVGSITSTTSATAYNTSSDERLKENIVDAPTASNDIDAIQVRSFDWKVDGEHQKYGMVAQELLEVAPDAVSTGDTEDDMMGVDYSKLVPMLVKEIQELRKRVADLEK